MKKMANSSFRRILWRSLKPLPSLSTESAQNSLLYFLPNYTPEPSTSFNYPFSPSILFSSRGFSSLGEEEIHVPAPIDYSSMLQEDEFNRLANSTIQDLLEKLEEYGDSVEINGFDVDYGNEVLTLKLGSLGTYVINKQTPNRQIWMSSPVSGPSRFDWDENARAWIYRRTKGDLVKVLESEIKQLCGESINLS